MRKWLSKILAGILVCSSILGMAACGGDDDLASLAEGLEGGDIAIVNKDKKVDKTKTQLAVKNFTAGFDDRWLYDLEARFEEAYKNVSYEDGKRGVQVWHTGDMKQFTAQDVISGTTDVYFMEGASYYDLTADGEALENLTDIVVNPNPDDNNKTILSKFTQQQKEFYGITGTDGDPKYYAIPHYEGGWGLIYNKELFDKKGYYMADVAEGEPYRLIENGDTKGTGPDGVKNTSDDGLPRTYDEFFFLCDEMVVQGDIPFCWSGQYREHYLTVFMNTLVAEYCGIEQMELNLTFEGEAEDLVVLDEDGAIVYENGEIKTERVTITHENGYDISRQAGKLYALEFLHRMITTDGYFKKSLAFNSTHTHEDAQEDFLKGGTSQSSDAAYGMLVDGPWWEAEATLVFNTMSLNDKQYSKKNRDFAWMPLPKATEAKVGSKNVYIDTLNALTCVKAGLGPKKQAALDFVRFSTTDESLVRFTQITGALKSYNYTLNEEQKDLLSPFAKTVIDYKENADTFVMNSGNSFYVKNETAFRLTSFYPNMSYRNPVVAFHETNDDGEDYFEEMFEYWSKASIWED